MEDPRRPSGGGRGRRPGPPRREAPGEPEPREWAPGLRRVRRPLIRRRVLGFLLAYLAGWIVLAVLAYRIVLG